MAKIKLTKTELKAQTDALKRFQRFLPMLQLKKQQLQAEIAGIVQKADEVMSREEKERAKKERSGVGRGLLGTLVGAAATSFIRSVSTSLAKSITGGTKSSGKTILGKAAQSATTTATRQIVNKTLKSILK